MYTTSNRTIPEIGPIINQNFILTQELRILGKVKSLQSLQHYLAQSSLQDKERYTKSLMDKPQMDKKVSENAAAPVTKKNIRRSCDKCTRCGKASAKCHH